MKYQCVCGIKLAIVQQTLEYSQNNHQSVNVFHLDHGHNFQIHCLPWQKCKGVHATEAKKKWEMVM